MCRVKVGTREQPLESYLVLCASGTPLQFTAEDMDASPIHIANWSFFVNLWYD